LTCFIRHVVVVVVVVAAAEDYETVSGWVVGVIKKLPSAAEILLNNDRK
jgi:hypothetical protein